jgi:hypothetical protein
MTSPMSRSLCTRIACFIAHRLGNLASLSVLLTATSAYAAPATTTTVLSISSSTVSYQTPIVLTATVTSNGQPVSSGLVMFCAVALTSCDQTNPSLAMVQLTSSTATAVVKIGSGPLGDHSYKAVYLANSSYASSTSNTVGYTVQGIYASATSLASSGTVGNYTLSAMVTGVGALTDGPTGNVEFIDTSAGNKILGTEPLGTSILTNTFTTAPGSPFEIGDASDTTRSVAIASAYLNADNNLDLVTGDADKVITVMLGNGDGSFQAKQNYPGCPIGNAIKMVLADFNRDGNTDIALGCSNSNTGGVAILLGHGDGSFANPVFYTSGDVEGLSLGDFNNDGILDIVVTGQTAQNVTVFLGKGNGTFGAGNVIETTSTQVNDVVVGDFNQDGNQDIAYAVVMSGQLLSNLYVALGNGDGTFKSPTLVASSIGEFLAAGDLNGDGMPDIVSTTVTGSATQKYVGQWMFVLLGNGKGSFQSPATYTADYPSDPSIADVNGDGIPDIIAGGSTGALVFLGNGDGTFQSYSEPSIGGFAYTYAVTTGDFNNDGNADLAGTDACPGGAPSACASVNVTYPLAAVSLSLVGETADASALTGVAVLPPGSGEHNVDASYPGNSIFSASVSSPVQLLAAPVPTTLTLVVSPTSATLTGQSVTLTATLNPYSVTGPPSTTTDGESVKFYSGSTLIASAPLSGGTAQLITTSLPVGSDALEAIYPGDTNYETSTSSVVNVTVAGILLSSSPNPSTYGQTVTLAATTAANASGNVTFMDGSNVLGTGGISGASASFSTSTLTGGTHNLTAVNGGSTSPVVVQTVNKASSSVSVAASGANTYGQSETLTATVTSGATGTVAFSSGSIQLGSGTISGGTASITTTVLPAGPDTITATYNGDDNYNGSNGSTSVTIAKANPTLALVASPSPGQFNQQVSLTATLSTVATGSIGFTSNSSSIGSATIGNNNAAVLTTSTLALGSDTIIATYPGDSNNNPASATITELIKQTPTVTVSLSPTTTTYGQTVTGTVSVTAGATGTLSVTGGGQTLYSGQVPASGPISFTTSSLPVGSDVITASYGGDTYDSPASGTATEIVNQIASTMSLSSSVNPSSVNQSVTFTATVPSVETGSITFYDGGTSLGVVPVASGIANFTTSTLSGGTHTITATYGGNTNYSSVTSSPLIQTVNKLNPSLPAPVVTPSSTTYGQTVTISETVPSGVSGPVTFSNGGTPIGTAPISGGVATITVSNLPVGTDPITASTPGDSLNNPATSPATNETVTKGTPTVSLTSSVNPSVAFQSVTFTATISGTVTGTVTFNDGSILIGTANVSNGAASIADSSLTVGTHTITATYNGDSNNPSATSSPLSQVVNKASPTLPPPVVNPSTTPYGGSVTITENVPPGVTGTVTFSNGSTPIGTATVSGGVATITVTNLPVGSDPITASTLGDSNNNPATSPATTVTVTKDSPTLPAPTVSNANPTPNSPETITEQVPSGVSGPVTFTDNGTVLGTSTVVSGTATLTVPSLPLGSNSIVASTPGDADNNPATSPATQVTVAKTTSTVTLASSANPSSVNQSVTFTATVPAGATGTVTFHDGSTVLGTANVNSAGVASFTTSTLLSGTHTITAVYSGDNNYGSATSAPLSQVVSLIPTMVALTQSSSTELLGTSVTFTATVSSTSPTPTGSVNFLDGTTVIGNAPLSTNGGTVSLTLSGNSSWATTSLTTGTHTITAVYSGDSNFATSTSAPVTNIVQDFTNTNSGKGSQSVMPGGSTSYTFTLAPVGATTFMDDVNLTVTGLPEGTNVTFSPANVSAGSASASVTMNVTTSSSLSASKDQHPLWPHRDAPIALGVLGLMGLGTLRKYRRKMPRMLVLLLLLAGSLLPVTALSGCAGGYFGFHPTTYSVTVTGAEGTIQHSATATLIVQ